jgi:hypothetical protein
MLLFSQKIFITLRSRVQILLLYSVIVENNIGAKKQALKACFFDIK